MQNIEQSTAVLPERKIDEVNDEYCKAIKCGYYGKPFDADKSLPDFCMYEPNEENDFCDYLPCDWGRPEIREKMERFYEE